MPHALISGGSSGIGLALARQLVSENWQVTLLARDLARLEAARAELGARASILSVDVRDEAAVARAVAQSGAPDLLVASAGIVIPGSFENLSAEAHRRTMEVNYFGTLHLVRAALPSMARGSRIVLISSGAGLIGLYGYGAYAPGKFALRGLGEVLRSELAPRGIGVSVVYPPDTDTPQLREELRLRPEITSALAGRAGVKSAEAVARAILRGVRRGRFTIAPGLEMLLLARFGGILIPLLNRFSFDPLIARLLKKQK